MSVHSSKFEAQVAQSHFELKEAERAVREAERARNPFRLTDAGMLWLVWLPLVVLVLGIALVWGEANYLFLKSVFIPDSTVSDSFELPTI